MIEISVCHFCGREKLAFPIDRHPDDWRHWSIYWLHYDAHVCPECEADEYIDLETKEW